MNQEKLKGLIGLCRRAGQLSLGTDTVLKQLKSGRCAAVLLDETAAPNTRKRLAEAAGFMQVPLFTVPEGLIDLATGQSGRITAAVAQGGLADQMRLLFTTAGQADNATDFKR